MTPARFESSGLSGLNGRPDTHEHADKSCEKECESIAYSIADITLPFELRPDTRIGDIKVECIGEPGVVCECESCGECFIIVTQKVKLRIPVKFGANAVPGKSEIRCDPHNDCKEPD